MSDNLPANVPARPPKEVSLQRKTSENPATTLTRVIQAPPAPRGMVLTRQHLAHFIRFASRVTARSAIPGLRCCLFRADSVVTTDLDVSLRTSCRALATSVSWYPSTSSSGLSTAPTGPKSAFYENRLVHRGPSASESTRLWTLATTPQSFPQ
jgi:hypothetical protein